MAKKKKSSAYWKKRFSELENAQNQYGQNTFHQIEPAFDKAQRQIQAQIESWYSRYAKNNGITMAEARKQLSAAELKELQWDVQEYIKYGQQNAMNQQWMKELENASARFHISRLEALKLRTQQSLEVAFGNELDSLDGMVKHLYQSGYYHTCFEVQKGFNIGWEIGQIDERKLQKIISKPWAADGKTFSDRVWQSKTTMVNELHQQLTRTIIQGKAPDEAIRTLSKYVADKTKNAKYAAGRLVMTEQAFISSVAQKDAFNDLDVEEFEIVATLDSHTSEICQNMDGQHFPMKDFEPGVTAPPFHVWCRSTTVPYFDDEWGRSGERAARGEDGKTYYVPSDMTYPEWQKSFVDGGDKSKLQKVESDDIMNLKTKIQEVDTEIADLKKQFSDITEGYSYESWFKDFKTIEEGYGGVITEADAPDVQRLKDITQKIKQALQRKTGLQSQLPVLGGQGTPMNIVDALKGANPNYASGTQYAVNCQRCVQTYELRRRGFDVEALPKPKKNNTVVWGNECFVDSSGNTPKFTFNQSESAIRSTLANAPDGSRHIIYVAWKNKSAHVFIAEKENGVIRYVDPQPNKTDVEHYFSLGKKNKFGILRVDDKDITTDDSILKATVRW